MVEHPPSRVDEATWDDCPRCGIVLRRREDVAGRRQIYQHGPNPEAVLIVTDQDIARGRTFGLGAWLDAIHGEEVRRWNGPR